MHDPRRAALRACLLAAVLALAAPGCGDGGHGTAFAEDRAGPDATSADLGDFPIPAPPGGKVFRFSTADSRAVLYPASRFDEVAQFYREWHAAEGHVGLDGRPPTVNVDEAAGTLGTGVMFEDHAYNVMATRDGDDLHLALYVLRDR